MTHLFEQDLSSRDVEAGRRKNKVGVCKVLEEVGEHPPHQDVRPRGHGRQVSQLKPRSPVYLPLI